MNERRHLDLFSGIGGFALAARWTGWDTIGFSEIDPYASRVLERHWPGVPNHGDIRNVRGIRADLITGGFPCQPYSVAGKQRGAEDDRALWPEMFRVIQQARPAWVLGENVAGIIDMELDRVLSDLEGEGYATQALVVPACAVDAKHRRDRVWIIANDDRAGCERSQRRVCENRNTSRGIDVGDCCRWKPESGFCRVAHGIPARVDRLKGLGNSIVPQIAYEILKGIAEIEQAYYAPVEK